MQFINKYRKNIGWWYYYNRSIQIEVHPTGLVKITVNNQSFFDLEMIYGDETK